MHEVINSLADLFESKESDKQSQKKFTKLEFLTATKIDGEENI